jgi:hypothetical protein
MADQDPYAEFRTSPSKTAGQAASPAATGDPYSEFRAATPKATATTAPAAKQPGLIDTANNFYNAPPAPGEGMIARIGRSLGRTAMMPVNIASAVVSPADEEEKKQGFTGVKQFGPLQAHRLAVAPSNQTETMLEDQETKDAAKGMPHSAIERWGNRAVNSIPLLGPAIINEGKRAGQGDIAGAATDVGTAIALPHVIEEALPGGGLPGARAAGETAFPATNAVVRGVGRTLKNPVVAHMAAPVAGAVTTALVGGTAPLDLASGVSSLAAGEHMGVPKIIQGVGERMSKVGLDAEGLRVHDMESQIKTLETRADELQKRFNLAQNAGHVPADLMDELRGANSKLAEKLNERRLSTKAGREEATQAAPTIARPTAGQPAGMRPVAAATPEAPFISQVGGMVDKASGTTTPPVRIAVPTGLEAAGAEPPFISQVEGMVNKASGSTPPPVKGVDLSIPSRPATQTPAGLPERSYVTSPNLGTEGASARVQDLLQQSKIAKPSAVAAREGLPAVSVARDVEGEAHPVKIVYDEHGIPTSETDGRHRVMQAIERGDQRIEVTVDRGHGPVKTTVDPKVLARQMGVDKESLAATDAQQSYRKGGLQPREAVKGNGSMVNKLGDEVERGLGGEPGMKQGVPMKDQFKSSGMTSEKPTVRESSSRPETQAFIDHGMNKAEGANLTKSLDRINNASMGEFAAKNGVDMGQNSVSRGQGGKSINRGAIVKDMLTRMSPEEIHAAVEKHVGKK